MVTAHRFEDLDAWQKARCLTKLIYEISSSDKWARDYGLKDQIRRAAVSAMSNIAEGFERRGVADFSRFLVMAKASSGEVRSQLYVALDLNYIDKNTFDTARSLAEFVSRLAAGLAGYLTNNKQTNNAKNL